MTHAEQLRAAKALIDTPEKWTTGVLARTKSGCPIGPQEDAATCYCAEGAIRRVQNGVLPHALESIMERAVPSGFRGACNERWFVKFNDAAKTTHADIMALFDRAIELAEQPA